MFNPIKILVSFVFILSLSLGMTKVSFAEGLAIPFIFIGTGLGAALEFSAANINQTSKGIGYDSMKGLDLKEQLVLRNQARVYLASGTPSETLALAYSQYVEAINQINVAIVSEEPQESISLNEFATVIVGK